MNKGHVFYLLMGIAIVLYVVAMVIGIPDHEYDEYTERSIGIIMRDLFMVPMAIFIPLIITGAIYSAIVCEDSYESECGNTILLFTYSSLSLLSAILFTILAQRHDEYEVTSWIYLSSTIILFGSIYFRKWGEK